MLRTKLVQQFSSNCVLVKFSSELEKEPSSYSNLIYFQQAENSFISACHILS